MESFTGAVSAIGLGETGGTPVERSPMGAVPWTVSIPIGNLEVPCPDGAGEELASSEATGGVTGDSDGTPEGPTGVAPTVTVIVFAEVTVTVACPHPPAAALPVNGDSVLPPPT